MATILSQYFAMLLIYRDCKIQINPRHGNSKLLKTCFEQERDFGGLGVDLLDDRSLHLAGNYYSWLCQGKLRNPGALKHNVLTSLIIQMTFMLKTLHFGAQKTPFGWKGTTILNGMGNNFLWKGISFLSRESTFFWKKTYFLEEKKD